MLAATTNGPAFPHSELGLSQSPSPMDPFLSRYERALAAGTTIQNTLPLNSQDRLKLYALQQQSQLGDCTSEKPYFWSIPEREKWDSWATLKGVPKQDAKDRYIRQLLRILRRFQDRPKVLELLRSFQDDESPVESITSSPNWRPSSPPLSPAQTVPPLQLEITDIKATLQHIVQEISVLRQGLDRMRDEQRRITVSDFVSRFWVRPAVLSKRQVRRTTLTAVILVVVIIILRMGGPASLRMISRLLKRS